MNKRPRFIYETKADQTPDQPRRSDDITNTSTSASGRLGPRPPAFSVPKAPLPSSLPPRIDQDRNRARYDAYDRRVQDSPGPSFQWKRTTTTANKIGHQLKSFRSGTTGPSNVSVPGTGPRPAPRVRLYNLATKNDDDDEIEAVHGSAAYGSLSLKTDTRHNPFLVTDVVDDPTNTRTVPSINETPGVRQTGSSLHNEANTLSRLLDHDESSHSRSPIISFPQHHADSPATHLAHHSTSDILSCLRAATKSRTARGSSDPLTTLRYGSYNSLHHQVSDTQGTGGGVYGTARHGPGPGLVRTHTLLPSDWSPRKHRTAGRDKLKFVSGGFAESAALWIWQDQKRAEDAQAQEQAL